jgi:hypothetical protein
MRMTGLEIFYTLMLAGTGMLIAFILGTLYTLNECDRILEDE